VTQNGESAVRKHSCGYDT